MLQERFRRRFPQHQQTAASVNEEMDTATLVPKGKVKNREIRKARSRGSRVRLVTTGTSFRSIRITTEPEEIPPCQFAAR